MVSILQALKVSILFLFLGIIPLAAAIFCTIAFAIWFTGDLPIWTTGGGQVFIAASPFIWLGGMVGGFVIFFVGLFKAIGDITEAALIE
ncbi:MAG: hypothetical protein GOP50_05990 [Candidatus Heimdallarchaeota archaeon]|nr:hypothetical protein [Candidatus Heimdallarchaeota archaeon]